MKNILLLLCAILLLSSCGFIVGDSKSKVLDSMIKEANKECPIDSPIEQEIEAVIEDTTGLVVDFSAGKKIEQANEVTK